MVKTTLFSLVALAFAVGCGSKGADPAACSAAASKGVDAMMAKRDMANVPPEMAQKITEMGGKLKDAISKRCNEDKWPKEVVDCVAAASTQPELKACREKLPQEAANKLRADEMQVMSSMMGGMGGMGGMRGHGMGGGSGMGDGSGGGMGGGIGSATAPAGSAMATPPATGSATAPAPAGSAH